MQQDADGAWRQAIPMPFFVWTWQLGWPILATGYQCGECLHRFNTEQAYSDHYRSDHPA